MTGSSTIIPFKSAPQPKATTAVQSRVPRSAVVADHFTSSRVCRCCNVELPLSAFQIERRVRDRRRSVCRDCTKAKLAGKHHVVHVDGVTYLAHRLAFLMHYGRAPVGEIDHIDGDPSNNAISNLREATRLENSRNRRSSAGVSRHKLRIKNPFQARIKHNGKARSIGVFPTFEAAREAYEREANKHFGEFSPARILGGRDSA